MMSLLTVVKIRNGLLPHRSDKIPVKVEDKKLNKETIPICKPA